MKAGQREQAEAVIRENYQRNPDYLFARLNYAELFLEKGDYEQVAEILEHKFDLKLLYPQRNRFHISEVANFMGLVGIYWVKIGKREAAQKYYELLEQVAPDYPMTKQLRSTLFPGLLQRLLGRR
jgi:tetratricopeptide (TPR) repeat protein